MNAKLNGTNLIKILQGVNCISVKEMTDIFGDEMGKHLFLKIDYRNGIKGLFEFDTENINLLVDFLVKKYNLND